MDQLNLFSEQVGQNAPGENDWEEESGLVIGAAAEKGRVAADETDLEGDEDFDPFQSQKQDIGRAWNLPVGRRVRVSFWGQRPVVEGVLRLEEHPQKIDGRGALKLLVERTKFSSREIEQCVVIED